jgi:hypothetical protein
MQTPTERIKPELAKKLKYPIEQLINARRMLIEELYGDNSKTDSAVVEIDEQYDDDEANLKWSEKSCFVFELKRKCGIFTKELDEFYESMRQPAGFLEHSQLEDKLHGMRTGLLRPKMVRAREGFIYVRQELNNEFSLPMFKGNLAQKTNESRRPMNREVLALNSNDADVEEPLTSSKSNTNSKPQKQQQQQSQIERAQAENIDNIETNQLDLLCRSLSMRHGCESSFCPRSMCVLSELNDIYKLYVSSNLVLVCDYCHVICSTHESASKHMQLEEHNSCSEFFISMNNVFNNTTNTSSEPHPSSEGTSATNSVAVIAKDHQPDENNEQQPDNSVAESKSKLAKRHKAIQFVKRRCSYSRLSKQPFFSHAEAISNAAICPICNFYFGGDVLAAALHFKYMHDKNELVYSTCTLLGEKKFTESKPHVCPECKVGFKKLKVLDEHMRTAKHFPYRKLPTEISVIMCPFDNCRFATVHFFSLKEHIYSHKLFNKSNPKLKENNPKVDVKVRIYSRSEFFYHLPMLNETIVEDRKDELEGLNALLDLFKGHKDLMSASAEIRARTSVLSSSI